MRYCSFKRLFIYICHPYKTCRKPYFYISLLSTFFYTAVYSCCFPLVRYFFSASLTTSFPVSFAVLLARALEKKFFELGVSFTSVLGIYADAPHPYLIGGEEQMTRSKSFLDTKPVRRRGRLIRPIIPRSLRLSYRTAPRASLKSCDLRSLDHS